MAKFFHDRVYNSKRTIINIVIIGVCLIGIIICFIITKDRKLDGEVKGELNIKETTTVEINEDFSKDVFFSKIENVDLNKIDIKYPDDYDISKLGTYEVEITVNGEKYTSNLEVVDTLKPTLEVKEVTIKENESYSPKSFVESCSDNSKKDCIINFYSGGVDEEGVSVDYTTYKTEGTYPIKIEAKDEAGNQTVAETKLIISKNGTTTEIPTPPTTEPATCKYGNGEYNEKDYTLAINITTNNCAVSLDLYKDANTTAEIDKLMDSETIRIKRDVEKANIELSGIISLNRFVNAITNKTGDGIVGYELRITLSISDNDTSKIIADYKLDKDGKRVFIENPYNIAS